MRRGDLVYYATAPIRLFGRSRAFRIAVAAVLVTGACFAVTLWALDRFFPPVSSAQQAVAKLPPLPPLPPVTRASYVIAPVAVSLVALRQSLDGAAPREFAGKNDNPVSKLLSKADIGITVSRGSMSVTGTPNELTINTPLTGTLQITGQLATQAGNLAGSLTGLLDSAVGKQIGGLTSQVLDQHAEVRGEVVVKSKPAIRSNWRLEPNLSAQVALGNSALTLAGLKVNMAGEARPLIEKAVGEQVAALRGAAAQRSGDRARGARAMGQDVPLDSARRRQDRTAAALAGNAPGARRRGAAAGRRAQRHAHRRRAGGDAHHAEGDQAGLSVPGAARTGAADGQWQARGRRADRRAVHRASTRCSRRSSRANVIPRTEGRRGRRRGARASVAAAGDRLLISLHVKAREKKSWFGFGAEADVLIWGKPVLDQQEPDPAAHRHFARRRIGSGRGCSASRRARRCPICSRRSPIRR